MAIRLNQVAFEHARKLVNENRAVRDGRDAWSEDQPSAQQENDFIEQHGFREYAKWHLGIDDEGAEDAKKTYSFPYGDFINVHRCAVISAESRAGQYKHYDVELAAAGLRGLLDEKKVATARTT